jgi:hypothetical protein
VLSLLTEVELLVEVCLRMRCLPGESASLRRAIWIERLPLTLLLTGSSDYEFDEVPKADVRVDQLPLDSISCDLAEHLLSKCLKLLELVLLLNPGLLHI